MGFACGPADGLSEMGLLTPRPFPDNSQKRIYPLASYHMHAQAIGRGAGRSAVAAAAYRSGECLRDERTGQVHDYTRKGGIEGNSVVLPGGASASREQVWNAV
ncbi:MAG: MobA/MobL family protein, partial [Rubrivivax sp.]